MKTIFIFLLVCFATTSTILSQKNIQEAETMAKSEFKKMHKHEIDEMKLTEKQYLDMKKEQFNADLIYSQLISKTQASVDFCKNGNFNNQILANDWIYRWGGGTFTNYTTVSGTSIINTGSFSRTDNHATEIHHLRVPKGPDPNISLLSTTDSPSNNFSLRLGNMGVGFGYESISKVINITPDNNLITFSYAMVCQDGGHTSNNPGFLVNITDATNPTINFNSLADLGNSSNMVLAHNPALNTTGQYKYKNWSCASIDLSSLNGRSVNIEFKNRDCAVGGGHFSYTYLDNICLGCQNPNDPEGNVSLNISKTDTCGVGGKVCVNYKVPTSPNPSMIIELKITQNGVVKKTLSSPNFTSNGSYCFTISQNDLNSLNATLGGFDYHLIGKPKSGSFSFSPKIEGSLAQGIKQNVIDYKLNCSPDPIYDPCCPPLTTKEEFTNLFREIPGSRIGMPYKIQYMPSSSLNNKMQAYLNYLKLSCGVNKLNLEFTLCEMNAAGTSCLTPHLEPKTVIFTANTVGPIVPAFFTTPLSSGKWYQISLEIKTDPIGAKCFEKTCDDKLIFKHIDDEKRKTTNLQKG